MSHVRLRRGGGGGHIVLTFMSLVPSVTLFDASKIFGLMYGRVLKSHVLIPH